MKKGKRFPLKIKFQLIFLYTYLFTIIIIYNKNQVLSYVCLHHCFLLLQLFCSKTTLNNCNCCCTCNTGCRLLVKQWTSTRTSISLQTNPILSSECKKQPLQTTSYNPYIKLKVFWNLNNKTDVWLHFLCLKKLSIIILPKHKI